MSRVPDARKAATHDSASARVTKTPLRVVLWTVLPALVIVAVSALQPFVPAEHLFRDAMVIAAAESMTRPWFGLFSHLGIALLLVAAGAGAVTAITLRGARADAAFADLVRYGTALTLLIALDDLLMVHEAFDVLLNNTGLMQGGELLVFAVYGVLATILVVRSRRFLMRQEPGLLVIVMIGLAVSLVTDVMVSSTSDVWFVVEDGAKLIAYVAWTVYFVRACAFGRRDLQASSLRGRRGRAVGA